jgi:hypothetical protein
MSAEDNRFERADCLKKVCSHRTLVDRCREKALGRPQFLSITS